MRHRLILMMLAMCCGLVTQLAWADNWPTIALPKNVRTFDVGPQLNVHGLPMRMQGFVSTAQPAQLLAWFRNSLGQPLVENTLGNQQIIGKAQGEHYLSVQIEAAGTGSRGIAAVTHLKVGYDNHAETQAETERWLRRLPSGSRLLSQMTTQDGSKQSRYLVMINNHPANLNRERLKSLMVEDGFLLERESKPNKKTAANDNQALLFFKGKGKEAVATINQDDQGRTTTVLNTINTINTISAMERFR